jgi:transposase
MVGLSVPEARRLMAALAAPPGERAHRLRWSRWRRAHQATARRGHAARRARDHAPPSSSAPPVVAVPGTPALTDAGWARVLPLLARARRTGRPPGDHRPILTGLLWLMGRGASWREVPADYGPWQTLVSRYQHWRRDGTWARIIAVLHGVEAQPQVSATARCPQPWGSDAGLHRVD